MPLSDLEAIIAPIQRQKKSKFKTRADFDLEKTPQQAKPAETPKSFPSPAEALSKVPIIGGIAKRVGEAINKGSEGVRESAELMQKGEINPAHAGINAALKTSGAVAEAAWAPISPLVEKAVGFVASYPKGMARDITNIYSAIAGKDPDETVENIKTKFGEAGSTVADAWGNFKETHPAAADSAEGAAGFLNFALTFLGGKVSKKVIEETTVPAIRGAVATFAEKAAAKKTAKIGEIISPKVTAKEGRAAIGEGRVARGKEGFFTGKAPDKITISNRAEKATSAVEKRVPNASKMTDVEIANKAKTQVGEISNKIRPKMESVPVSKETAKSVDTAIESAKTGIQATEEFGLLTPASGKTLIGRLDRLSASMKGEKNLANVWDERIAWDGSFSKTVKKGGETLSDLQRLQRDVWIRGRETLNDAITNTKTGLGAEAQGAFDDMSGLFTARESIITHGVDIKGKAGLFSKEKLLQYGTAYGAAKLFEKVTGIDVPLL